jgi:hypothetical protein
MNSTEIRRIKALLDALHDEDGHQLGEVQLHVAVNKRCLETLSLPEFNALLAVVDMSGWVIAVPQKFKRGKLRCSSEAGEAARLEGLSGE